MRFIESTQNERDVLERVQTLSGSLMTFDERLFLTALLLREKPKKILELGVAAGGSSVTILNAMQEFHDSQLHSVDIQEFFWDGSGRRMGYLVDDYPELKRNWDLYTGNLPCQVMERIGGGIDFCLLDTMHILPGEFLDFLSILPYLSDDCMVVFHDTELHVQNDNDFFKTTNLLLNALPGEKFSPPLVGKAAFNGVIDSFAFNAEVNYKHLFPNIGGVRLNRSSNDLAWSALSMLTMQWNTYYDFIGEHEIDLLRRHFSRFYDQPFMALFNQIVTYQRHVFDRYRNMRQFMESLNPVYIFGANQRGEEFLEFCRRHSLPFEVKGFFDMHPDKHGKAVSGLPVTAPFEAQKSKKSHPYVFLTADDSEKWDALTIAKTLNYTPMFCAQFLWVCVLPYILHNDFYKFDIYSR